MPKMVTMNNIVFFIILYRFNGLCCKYTDTFLFSTLEEPKNISFF